MSTATIEVWSDQKYVCTIRVPNGLSCINAHAVIFIFHDLRLIANCFLLIAWSAKMPRLYL